MFKKNYYRLYENIFGENGKLKILIDSYDGNIDLYDRTNINCDDLKIEYEIAQKLIGNGGVKEIIQSCVRTHNLLIDYYYRIANCEEAMKNLIDNESETIERKFMTLKGYFKRKYFRATEEDVMNDIREHIVLLQEDFNVDLSGDSVY